MQIPQDSRMYYQWIFLSAYKEKANTSKKMAKIMVIGLGGVGTIAAMTLQMNGNEVTAVARSTYETLSENGEGFSIESCDHGAVEGWKPTHVSKSAEEASKLYGPFDYIVITTKNIPDVNPVEKIIEKAYSKDTAIVLLENGVGIERSMFKAFPDATVISGVTMISSTVYGNKVKHVGPDNVSFGPFINPNLPKESQIAKAKEFVELYSHSANSAKYDENVKYIRWRKLIYNGAINSTCAITNVDVGRLELFGGMDSIVRPAMKEIMAIAKSDGAELPEDIMEFMIRSDDGEYYPPSMLMDIRKKQFTEYQTILGTAIEIANENGVPCVVLSILKNLLEVIQMRTKEEKGMFELPEQRPLPEDNYKIEYKW